ncbi:Hpt domain-containing protein [Rhodoferax sp. GW822-FHT02A01]|jgi:HPt (histidine-containing phosphotransfer) domain-containing protein|uniref:Hpt domain-containing protein n=1 Tax=Rhodoferax sp. GW822-FHT02A01 TaxID=3141537 RepID=UPI00315CC483
MPLRALDNELELLPLWDAGALARAVGDNPTIHKRLLGKYLESAPATASAIATSVAHGDWQSASEHSHRLKSSSRAVGAMRLGALCEALEREGRAANGAGCTALAQAVLSGFEMVATLIRAQL